MKKKIYINTDAGNVEAGIAAFNSSIAEDVDYQTERKDLIALLKAKGYKYANYDKFDNRQLYRMLDKNPPLTKAEVATPKQKPTCNECGNYLTDGGYCPVCDDGEEHLKESFSMENDFTIKYEQLPVKRQSDVDTRNGYPDWDEWEDTVDYELQLSTNDVDEGLLAQEGIWNEPGIDDDNAEEFVAAHRESLFDKYGKELKEYFKDIAITRAQADVDSGKDNFHTYSEYDYFEDEYMDKARGLSEYFYDDDDDIESSEYTRVSSKSVEDSDGFMTDYTWYKAADGNNIFIFGDNEIYTPENTDWDWEEEDDEAAQEWFNSYTGFGDPDDYFDESVEKSVEYVKWVQLPNGKWKMWGSNSGPELDPDFLDRAIEQNGVDYKDAKVARNGEYPEGVTESDVQEKDEIIEDSFEEAVDRGVVWDSDNAWRLRGRRLKADAADLIMDYYVEEDNDDLHVINEHDGKYSVRDPYTKTRVTVQFDLDCADDIHKFTIDGVEYSTRSDREAGKIIQDAVANKHRKSFDVPVDEAWERDYNLDEWEEDDIELHKSIDWKARNYKDYPVPEDSITATATAYGLPGGTQEKSVKFIKYIRANELFPPYYGVEEIPFEGVLSGMYDGDKNGKYMIMNRFETQDVYDALSEDTHTIKLSGDDNMIEIPIEDNSEVGELGHPIQHGIGDPRRKRITLSSDYFYDLVSNIENAGWDEILDFAYAQGWVNDGQIIIPAGTVLKFLNKDRYYDIYEVLVGQNRGVIPFNRDILSEYPLEETLTEDFKEGDLVYVKPSKKSGRVVSVKGDVVTVEIDGGKDPDRRDTFYTSDLVKDSTLTENMNTYSVTFYMDSLDDSVMSGPSTTKIIRANSEEEAEKKLMDSSTDKYYIPTVTKVELVESVETSKEWEHKGKDGKIGRIRQSDGKGDRKPLTRDQAKEIAKFRGHEDDELYPIEEGLHLVTPEAHRAKELLHSFDMSGMKELEDKIAQLTSHRKSLDLQSYEANELATKINTLRGDLAELKRFIAENNLEARVDEYRKQYGYAPVKIRASKNEAIEMTADEMKAKHGTDTSPISVLTLAKSSLPTKCTQCSGTNEDFRIHFDDGMTGEYVIQGKLDVDTYNIQVEEWSAIHLGKYGYSPYMNHTFYYLENVKPKKLVTLFNRWSKEYDRASTHITDMNLRTIFKGWNVAVSYKPFNGFKQYYVKDKGGEWQRLHKKDEDNPDIINAGKPEEERVALKEDYDIDDNWAAGIFTDDVDPDLIHKLGELLDTSRGVPVRCDWSSWNDPKTIGKVFNNTPIHMTEANIEDIADRIQQAYIDWKTDDKVQVKCKQLHEYPDFDSANDWYNDTEAAAEDGWPDAALGDDPEYAQRVIQWWEDNSWKYTDDEYDEYEEYDESLNRAALQEAMVYTDEDEVVERVRNYLENEDHSYKNTDPDNAEDVCEDLADLLFGISYGELEASHALYSTVYNYLADLNESLTGDLESKKSIDSPTEKFFTKTGKITQDGNTTRISFDISKYIGGRNRETLELLAVRQDDGTYDVSLTDSWLSANLGDFSTVYTLSAIPAERINTIIRRVDAQLAKPMYNINAILRGMPAKKA